jgi:hypothetical protein
MVRGILCSALLVLAGVKLSYQQTVNRTQTNGWGSTPSQRHYINQTQALQVLQAGMARASAIG